MQYFIDCHAHLDDEAFDEIRDQLIADLKSDGIELLINCASDFATSQSSLKLANENPHIYCVLGCHPHDAKSYDKQFADFLIKNATNPKTVAIGEIGLDYHYDYSPRDIQRQAFVQQIKLASTRLAHCYPYERGLGRYVGNFE